MNFDPEYLKELVLDKIAGTIDEESDLFLRELIAEDPEALKIYRSLHEQYKPEDLRRIEELAPAYEAAVWQTIHRRKSRQLWLRASVGVAAAIAVFLGVYLSWFSRSPSFKSGQVASHISKQIILRLPGEEVIDLSGSQGEMKVGSTHLNNINKTLTYSSAVADNKTAILTVPPGKDYVVRLDDGTEIQLNAATRLEFPLKFSGATREIVVDGEAYIKVAKDEKRPFIVNLSHSQVQVLGTEFNVNTYDAGQEKVALVEGAVKMITKENSLVLTPGNEGTYTKDKGIEVDRFSTRDCLSWRKGLYFFHNATFEEVSKILPRWFGVEVIIQNHETGNSRFTGFIDRNAPIAQSLDLLKETNAFNYVISGDTVLIR
ncbi:FecR family protein [Chitinophaga sp. S165]|uniref:FecR family protein n=1 Tax=Chitinophaga sp. S165 TaxID=2135462 RepID=UPI000D7119FC|nr:FecR family protein [Chitinophaga sp. S165]PWV51935.1 FecR family protein [Chitinophaga sp. S165]